jgi:hypothetical protein
MQTRFNFDTTGATVAIAILTPGFLMMAAGFVGMGSTPKLVLSLPISLSILAALWFALARGTYVDIDTDKNVYSTSSFFIVKTVPLSGIIKLDTQSTFAGLFTEIRLTYRTKDGELKTINTMNMQSFKKGDFKKYIEILRAAKVDIPSELLKK